jgi:hypothetical protein
MALPEGLALEEGEEAPAKSMSEREVSELMGAGPDAAPQAPTSYIAEPDPK